MGIVTTIWPLGSPTAISAIASMESLVLGQNRSVEHKFHRNINSEIFQSKVYSSSEVFRYKEKRWDLKWLVGSRGMTSSHSATVTALAMALGLQEGFGGSHFAMAFILTSIVMYDATGVRIHAGRQAEVLNQIVYNFMQIIPSLKAHCCVKFWVILLHRKYQTNMDFRNGLHVMRLIVVNKHIFWCHVIRSLRVDK